MAEQKAKKLPLWKRIAGLGLILFVMLAAMSGGFWSTWNGQDSGTSDAAEMHRGIVAAVIIMFIMGLGGLIVGGGLYAVVLSSRCFTSDFSKPIWDHVKKRLVPMNLLTLLFMEVGLAGVISMAATPIMMVLGCSASLSLGAPFFFVVIVLQLLSVWLNIWQPLEKPIIRSRLAARGVTPAFLETGIYVGISDPAKKGSQPQGKRKTRKKQGIIEDDIGMLWLGKSQLIYAGDTEDLRISRQQLLEVERMADMASSSSYFGNVPVILRFLTADGTETRRRLHPEGLWTMTGKARASDELAERINAWREGVPASQEAREAVGG